MKKLLAIIATSIIAFTLMLAPAHAGVSSIPGIDTLPGPDLSDGQTELEDPRTFTANVLPNLAIGLIGFVSIGAVVMLIVAGVRYSLSFGSDEANEAAKQQMIWAIVGLGVALLAYTIVTIIINLDIREDITEQRQAQQAGQSAGQSAGQAVGGSGANQQP